MQKSTARSCKLQSAWYERAFTTTDSATKISASSAKGFAASAERRFCTLEANHANHDSTTAEYRSQLLSRLQEEEAARRQLESALLARLDSLDSSMAEDASAMRRESQILMISISRNDAQLESLQQALASIEEPIESLKRSVLDVDQRTEAQLAGLEVRTNGMLGEMDALVLKAKATEKRVKAADDALTETCSKQAAQAAESAEVCKQLDKVRRQLSALSEERRNDSELLGCIRGDLVRTDTNLEKVGARLDAAELGARSLGEKLGAVEGGLDRARAAESSWTEQLNAARTKLRDLSNQLETVDSLAQAVSHLRTEMPQARVDLKLEIDKLRSHGNEVTDKLKLHIEGRLGSVEDGATAIAGNYRRAFSLFPCASASWPTLCRRLIALRFRHKRRSAPS